MPNNTRAVVTSFSQRSERPRIGGAGNIVVESLQLVHSAMRQALIALLQIADAALDASGQERGGTAGLRPDDIRDVGKARGGGRRNSAGVPWRRSCHRAPAPCG